MKAPLAMGRCERRIAADGGLREHGLVAIHRAALLA
jgi:hypothetical protein